MRTDTTPEALLEWIVSQLRTSLGLSESQCFLAADALGPAAIPPADLFLTVAPGPGRFWPEEQEAQAQIYLQWTVRVRIWLRAPVDPAGRGEKILTDAQRGLFRQCQRVLQVLCGADHPKMNLRRTLTAINLSEPQWLTSEGKLTYLSTVIDFAVDFDWQTTG